MKFMTGSGRQLPLAQCTLCSWLPIPREVMGLLDKQSRDNHLQCLPNSEKFGPLRVEDQKVMEAVLAGLQHLSAKALWESSMCVSIPGTGAPIAISINLH